MPNGVLKFTFISWKLSPVSGFTSETIPTKIPSGKIEENELESVVESGTAASTRIKGIIVCGKTGTAQNPHGKDHSMYVAFAPKYNPKIAIAVSVENSGFGSQWAAPIAALLIEKYLTDTITRPEMDKRMREGVILPEIALPKVPVEKDNKIITKRAATPVKVQTVVN